MLVTAPLAVVGGGSSVGAGVAAVLGGVRAIASGVAARVDRHLGTVFSQRVANGGAQIAAGGALVTCFGGAVAVVCAAVVFVAIVGRTHNHKPKRSTVIRGGSERLGWDAAGHQTSVASASWSIPALADEVASVREAAVQFAHAHGVPDRLLADLRLAISEAVTNAVVHAFRSREQPGTVTVSVDVRTGRIAEVIVRDDGMGMSRRNDSPGLGLGLGIIARLADQVEHRAPDDGTGFELWMCFRLDFA